MFYPSTTFKHTSISQFHARNGIAREGRFRQVTRVLNPVGAAPSGHLAHDAALQLSI